MIPQMISGVQNNKFNCLMANGSKAKGKNQDN
jgi:hypothetical protein